MKKESNKEQIKYRPMKKGEEEIVTQYIKGLFLEDPTPKGMSDEKMRLLENRLPPAKAWGSLPPIF